MSDRLALANAIEQSKAERVASAQAATVMHTGAEQPPDTRMAELMQEALDALRRTLERVEWQGDQAEAKVAAAEARADAERQRAEDLRAQIDALRDRVVAMREQLADAHAALQAAETAGARAERAERDKER
ncbi:MAG TPA: hypothetical protein VF213_07210, partial [Dongiaceae bacterium]